MLHAASAAAAQLSPFQEGLNKTADGTGHKTLPIGDPSDAAGMVIGAALSLMGVLFLILIIYSGFLWMTARGDEQAIEQAKTNLKNSIIGLLIVVGAYAITNIIRNYLSN